jgi:hypothetical protein
MYGIVGTLVQNTSSKSMTGSMAGFYARTYGRVYGSGMALLRASGYVSNRTELFSRRKEYTYQECSFSPRSKRSSLE